jgi:hypothetical protein
MHSTQLSKTYVSALNPAFPTYINSLALQLASSCNGLSKGRIER